jgi:signal transduction histidine kinase
MGIAEAHGGSLTLIPTDVGACFRLSLPCPPEADQGANLVSVSARR